MRFDRKQFFKGFRERLDSTIEQEQVDGLEFLLGQFEGDARWSDVRHVAYALATIFHETAASFQPVEEGYYLGSKAKAFQKKLRYFPYFGRGYVQLTWKKNYEVAGQTLRLDLVDHPELALQPVNAFSILTEGLFRGWFGGRLTTYINSKKTDYVGARRCVNVQDKAGLIAGYAKQFENILRSAADPSTMPDPSSITRPAVGAIKAEIPSAKPQPSQAEGAVPPPTQAEGQTIVDVPPVATEPPEGIVSKFKTWYAALPAFLTAAGGGFISWLQGAATEIIVAFFATAGAVAIAFIITNYKARQNDKQRDFEAKEKQKERDFELTKLQMQSAMDPKKQTVRIAPPPTEIPATSGDTDSAGN